MPESLTLKQAQFNAALERYQRVWAYRWTGKVVSCANIALQATLVALAAPQSMGPIRQLWSIAVAYFLADFVNGWVHLYMDNSEDYGPITGPFFAAFHLHHRTPRYRQRPVIVVYFNESGSKLWLVFVQLLLVLGVWRGWLTREAAWGALYFSVLSSVAEVSHYLCHVRPTRTGHVLAWLGLLMSRRHHLRHHREDNVQYAFLNGMSDPLLNLIAKRFYPGYKTTTDTHYANYRGANTGNRAVS